MDKFRGIAIFFLLFFIVSFSNQQTVADGGGGHSEGGPNAIERAIGITTPRRPWATAKSWLNLAWLNLRPPILESTHEDPSSAGDAVKKSFQTSKSTAKDSAKSAAKVAEEAVEKTKEKVKKTFSNSRGGPDAEL